MSIKTSVGEPKTQKQKPFPKLMISEDRTIILAIDNTPNVITGVVLVSHYDGVSPIGYYSQNFNPKSFTDYNQPITITIQNQ